MRVCSGAVPLMEGSECGDPLVMPAVSAGGGDPHVQGMPAELQRHRAHSGSSADPLLICIP